MGKLSQTKEVFGPYASAGRWDVTWHCNVPVFSSQGLGKVQKPNAEADSVGRALLRPAYVKPRVGRCWLQVTAQRVPKADVLFKTSITLSEGF